MCMARGGLGGDWMRGLGLGSLNPVGTGGCETCVSVWVAALYVVWGLVPGSGSVW